VVEDCDEAERRAAEGERVVLMRPTTSPEDVHGIIAAQAVITEVGGSTSHAAVVSRSLNKPCVVGCGPGTAAVLAGRYATVDGEGGEVLENVIGLEEPREQDHPYLAELAAWAGNRRLLDILDARDSKS
jgi:pyruvate,orthophosphate dikinase